MGRRHLSLTACAWLLVAALTRDAAAEGPPAVPVTDTTNADSDVRVRAARPAAPRGPSDVRVTREQLEIAPASYAPELLSRAPGFFVDHEDGEGVANDVNVRGFDLEHGGGLEVKVGAVPINIPAHIHGQGYADMNFMIPETLRGIRVVEGVHDPRQGDFALGGSAYFDLGVKERGLMLKQSYGSFGQWGAVGIWAPRGEAEETFAAVSVRHTPGFGPGNRASSSASASGQYALDLSERDRAIVTLMAYDARATLPGVLRQDDVDYGQIGFFDSYRTPSASGQSAFSSRLLASVDYSRTFDNEGFIHVATWAMRSGFRLRENYSGAILPPGYGDLRETSNDETAIGGDTFYRSRTYSPASFVSLRFEPGLSVRHGRTDQSHDLVTIANLTPWQRITDQAVSTTDLGVYVDADATLWERLHLQGGVRADALLTSVDDHVAAANQSAFGLVPSPRVSLAFDATKWLTPIVSFGEGFRSPSALQLKEGQSLPFGKARTVEAGVRADLDHRKYVMRVAAYSSTLSDELVFDPETGTLQSAGASTRNGILASMVAKPVDWLVGLLSFSYTHATLDETGELVPKVPALLVRSDMGATRTLGHVAGHALTGRLGWGWSYLGMRALEGGAFRKDSFVLNASAGLRYRAYEIGVQAFNLLDRRYADDEFVLSSNWSATGAPRADGDTRHFTAAAPRTVIASLTLHL